MRLRSRQATEPFSEVNDAFRPPIQKRLRPIIWPPLLLPGRCSPMMTRTKMLCARVSVSAIAATLALSPIHATVPKPIVDLSKSPALSGKTTSPPPKQATTGAKPKIGPFDEQTAALGGGAILLLALGGGAAAASLRSRRRRRDEVEWQEEAPEAVARDPLFDEPMFQDKPATETGSAFAWGNPERCDQPSDDGSDRCPGETWVERAYRGPSPANPSASLKHRLSRAVFFDKREREVAAGRAKPIEPDAGLPEEMADDRALEGIS